MGMQYFVTGRLFRGKNFQIISLWNPLGMKLFLSTKNKNPFQTRKNCHWRALAVFFRPIIACKQKILLPMRPHIHYRRSHSLSVKCSMNACLIKHFCSCAREYNDTILPFGRACGVHHPPAGAQAGQYCRLCDILAMGKTAHDGRRRCRCIHTHTRSMEPNTWPLPIE